MLLKRASEGLEPRSFEFRKGIRTYNSGFAFTSFKYGEGQHLRPSGRHWSPSDYRKRSRAGKISHRANAISSGSPGTRCFNRRITPAPVRKASRSEATSDPTPSTLSGQLSCHRVCRDRRPLQPHLLAFVSSLADRCLSWPSPARLLFHHRRDTGVELGATAHWLPVFCYVANGGDRVSQLPAG